MVSVAPNFILAQSAQNVLPTGRLGTANLALIVAGSVTIVLVGIFAVFYRKLLGWKRGGQSFHQFTEISEWVLALGISASTGFFELWKLGTWRTPPNYLAGATGLTSAMLVTYLCVKYLASAAKSKDADEIRRLRGDREEFVRKNELLERQRNSWLFLMTHVRKLIDKKMQRVFKACKQSPSLSRDELLAALDPNAQIMLIVQGIYEHFSHKKLPGAQLRLGLYGRSSDPNQLQLLYSWDGEKRTCFSPSIQNYLRIDDPEGIKSQLAKCFHSRQTIILIESCLAAEKRGEFHFFTPQQKDYLKSMVLFKHVYDLDGNKDAMIVTLDSSQEGVFRADDEEEIRDFLLEMTTRIEYEMTVLSAQKPNPNPQ